MNLLVYKGEAQTTAARRDHVSAPPDAPVSEVLMAKLAVKDEERYSDYSQRQMLEKGANKSQSNRFS